MIFALQGHWQRCHRGHLRIVLVMEPLKNTIAIVWSLVCCGHDRKTVTVVDNYQLAANKVRASMSSSPCLQCSHQAVSCKSCWRRLFFCFCPASAGGCGGAWLAIGRHNRRCQSCTLCTQCTTGVQCSSCLSHVQICVCVSPFP